eukprot:2729115-Rhodomonas_salina.1
MIVSSSLSCIHSRLFFSRGAVSSTVSSGTSCTATNPGESITPGPIAPGTGSFAIGCFLDPGAGAVRVRLLVLGLLLLLLLAGAREAGARLAADWAGSNLRLAVRRFAAEVAVGGWEREGGGAEVLARGGFAALALDGVHATRCLELLLLQLQREASIVREHAAATHRSLRTALPISVSVCVDCVLARAVLARAGRRRLNNIRAQAAGLCGFSLRLRWSQAGAAQGNPLVLRVFAAHIVQQSPALRIHINNHRFPPVTIVMCLQPRALPTPACQNTTGRPRLQRKSP